MKKVIGLGLLLGLLFGCAYYNTFFNAEKYFAEAQELELRENGKPKPAAVQKYNKVIKKCGIIITDFPNSDYVDDAVMLLGKSLFYKGTSYKQAADKFNDILTFYPNSEFVPEAHLYLAMVDYKTKKKDSAYQKLKEFILEPKFKKYHARALYILANYYLEDENLSEADYYFNQIITKYPKSEEYEDAFFARGKTFFLSEKYENSNEVFNALLHSRISKQRKLDARYYMALNYLLMGEYEKAKVTAEKLLKKENRVNKRPKIKLILARTLAKTGEVDDSIELLKKIIENNQRTFLSAEACFHLAEIYFEFKKDYDKAIEYYNRVGTEKRNSPFKEEALSKSVVAAQIIQYYQPNTGISQEDLVEQQFMLAEHYLNTLDMPDSVLVVYDNIIADKDKLEAQVDSLRQKEILLYESLQDSLAKVKEIGLLDSIKIDKSLSDSLLVIDSLKTQKAIIDSSSYIEVKTKRKNLENVIKKYDEEFIPYTKFLKLWLYKNVIIDSLKAEEVYSSLLELPEENKYVYAAKKMWNNEPIKFSNPKLEKEETEYNQAILKMDTAPQESLELLEKITSDSLHSYYDKALYSAGYINYAILSDSTKARPFFEKILQDRKNEFVPFVEKFYKNGKFTVYERLPYLEELEKKQAEEEEKPEIDEKNQPAKVVGEGKIKWPLIRVDLDTNVIIVELDISAKGEFTDCRVIQSLKEDKPSIDKIVISQIENWEFKPALKDGKPVDSTLRMNFIYEQEKK